MPEALPGGNAWRVLSLESIGIVLGADVFFAYGRQHRASKSRDASGFGGVRDPLYAWKLITRDAGDPGLIHMVNAKWPARKTWKGYSR